MKRIYILLIVFLLLVSDLAAQDIEPSIEVDELTTSSAISGLIFNTSNILFDLDSYMGGIGLKFMFPNNAIRTSIGGGFETGSPNQLTLSGSFIFEKPIYRAIVTPYIGGVLEIDFTFENQTTDEENWTKTQALSGGLGGLFGAEVFITNYLSFFMEYKLSFNTAWSKITSNASGELSEPIDAVNYNISADLGNSGSIGVVIYFQSTSIKSPVEVPDDIRLND